MRVFLTCLVASLCVMAASAQANCIEDQEECQPDECCIQDGNTSTGVCRKRHVIDQNCRIRPIKVNDHVYLGACPCLEGLICTPSNGVLGKLAGTCQQESGEQTEEPSQE